MWQEYTQKDGEAGDDLVQYKKDVVAKYGEEGIKKSWLEVCEALKKVTDEIAEKKTGMIPEVQYSDFAGLSDARKQELKDVGCFVVRGVIEKDVVEEWFKDLKSYIAKNQQDVRGKIHQSLLISAPLDQYIQKGTETYLITFRLAGGDSLHVSALCNTYSNQS